LSVADNQLEFAHQTTLLWSEIGHLKDFLALSNEIDELVAEFRTARHQFLKLDTPKVVVAALVDAFDLIASATRFDESLVDQVIDRIEAAGVDTFAQDGDSN
jgi:hypothetical protein